MKLLFLLITFLYIPNAIAMDYCSDAQNQLEMNECSLAEYKDAYMLLNQTYQAAIKRLNEHEKPAEDIYRNEDFLSDTQRLWIEYRDRVCNFSTGERKNTGTIYPLARNKCMTRLTQSRTEAILKSFVEGLDLESKEK